MNIASKTGYSPRLADRMEGMKASEIRELLKLLDRPGIIAFAGGIPDPVLFPQDEVRRAYDAVLSDSAQAAAALQYSVSEGDPELRDWICGYMAERGVTCTRDNILITSGSQQGLEFLGKYLLSPADTALVAAPTYLGALQAFSANQPTYDLLGGPGTNRTAASYAAAATAAGGTAKFAYVVPDFANPSGETMDVAERRALLALATELDVPVIEDSPYVTLRYDGAHQSALQSLDGDDINQSRVIHCGSFSKVFTPGLRVGWVCAARPVIEKLTLIKQASDLSSSAMNQKVMLHLARTRYNQQVTEAIAHYRPKRDAMLDALRTHMPDGVTWTEPEGGLFVWVTLPDGMDCAALLSECVEKDDVAFVPGHAFFADGTGRNTLRLSFSLPPLADIRRGIAALAARIKVEMLKIA
ncbi:aminotransferase-like domain-containing protein [Pontivivens insulae]|uniref:2-aminoadipate transaminase n=1 Tax=Pontivivens insulae TaxID=1639689 RepID=A0A2R8A9L4_9RHOB|nr:PLP-dependent aminotransferase family protein [Pontivivens insulae]RED12836.1 DNA-binding transcriptional MocR family regulator [Pontivivens insulae]SPF28927.1 2-aminoadipate transaminase [Pontivivens insulae]